MNVLFSWVVAAGSSRQTAAITAGPYELLAGGPRPCLLRFEWSIACESGAIRIEIDP